MPFMFSRGKMWLLTTQALFLLKIFLEYYVSQQISSVQLSRGEGLADQI